MRMLNVFVLNRHGRPLMPCTPAKARHLLKAGKAKVKKITPFTIQLLYGSTGYTQEVILGVDAGSKTIGISCGTKDKELFSGEVIPRNDVVEKLSTRREFRHARRNRKTRYRQPRFNNRVKSKHKGWLAPSVEVKIQEHITVIKRICNLLPVSKVIVEGAEFDLQFIKAVEEGKPVPQGEDYQKGEMLGHYNVRQFVLWRDGYKCYNCGAHKDVDLRAHHLESRKIGGDAPNNLITLCKKCHDLFHKGAIQLEPHRGTSYRDTAFMGIMRKTLFSRLRAELNIPVYETRGYITKYTREYQMHLPKNHVNDALAICHGPHGFNNGEKAIVERAPHVYLIKPVRHHNRQLHKATILKGGIRKSNQSPKYVKGFRLFDKVRYDGQDCFVWGRRTTGSFLLRKLTGEKVKDGVGYKHLKLLERSQSYLIA